MKYILMNTVRFADAKGRKRHICSLATIIPARFFHNLLSSMTSILDMIGTPGWKMCLHMRHNTHQLKDLSVNGNVSKPSVPFPSYWYHHLS